MRSCDLYSDSERCTLNADTFSELLVTYDPNIDNLKVPIRAIKEASSLNHKKKEVNQLPFSKDLAIIDYGNKSGVSSQG